MVHKAFELIGKKIFLDVHYLGEISLKKGVFVESRKYITTDEGKPRPALDFIEAIYPPFSGIEYLAREIIPKRRVNLDNPIIHIQRGIELMNFEYMGIREDAHVFMRELFFVAMTYLKEDNREIYNIYSELLKKAGFRIK